MINIAIDGPAGAGKSTIAKGVAARLGFIYVDTGALYRTVALACVRAGVDPADEKAVGEELKKIRVELGFKDGTQLVYLNGEEVGDQIRTPQISMCTSAVSKIPAVRAFLLDLQRDIAVKHNILMDGRDIATVVLPNADLKVFLFASAECRAERRYKELVEKGQNVIYDDVLADIKQRDYQDSHREIAPLKPAEDAVMFDTTGYDLPTSIDKMIGLIHERFGEV